MLAMYVSLMGSTGSPRTSQFQGLSAGKTGQSPTVGDGAKVVGCAWAGTKAKETIKMPSTARFRRRIKSLYLSCDLRRPLITLVNHAFAEPDVKENDVWDIVFDKFYSIAFINNCAILARFKQLE
jgi:hypothetical protein